MQTKNIVILMGFLGADPEVRGIADNEIVVGRLATTETFKKKEGDFESITHWHTVKAFGRLAKRVKELDCKKGDFIWVKGMLVYSSDGGKVYTDIKCREWSMISRKDKKAGQQYSEEEWEGLIMQGMDDSIFGNSSEMPDLPDV